MGIRIVLADDHAGVRRGWDRAIQKEKDMEVVGQAEDGRTAVKLARELAPDVVVMAMSLRDRDSADVARKIRQETPDVRVVALSMHSAKCYVTEMFKAGAAAYLLKDCDFDELARAIRTAAQGKTYVSPSIGDVVVEDLVQRGREHTSTAFSLLTQRERDVLGLLAEGMTTKQIALCLHISPKTVEAHRLRLMKKLEIDNVARLTKYAIREGLTSPEP